ncbi:MAG TPA: pyrroloquinoline quinone-dependent dehydrogenase, partial [Terriglobia bacterium]|nr:pyrroloquinoline quinone-dependent dehydrogenase [Terriglobia bacterium]
MKQTSTLLKLLILLLVTLFLPQCKRKQTESVERYTTWQVNGGGPGNIHYSALKQIDRANVSQLQVAWKFDTGDAFPKSEMECNPIIV